VVAASTPDEEAQFIAEMILKLRDEGTPLSEIAVLFRATFHSQTLEFELTKRDIPYDYRGGVRFFERSHIKDVLSFLKIRANLQDEVSWLRVLRIQTGIGTETAGKIFNVVRNQPEASLQHSVLSQHGVLQIPERAKAGWNDFTKSVQMMFAAGDSPAESIRAIVKSPYGDYLDAEFPNAEERREDLEQLAVFAEKYDSIGGFAAEAALHEGFSAKGGSASGGGASGGDNDAEKIVLSTIHQAKGLEWDAVFVMHLFDGGFPNARAMNEPNGIEEERRLFYVACTRARKQLYLTYPIVGGGHEGYLHQISQFLRELPEEAFERMELRRETTVWKSDDFEEDSVELDGMGEVKKTTGFLRSVDEL
jgi:DNA helicase-2/ATP-dependent DNA helicase PcrA